MDVAEGTPLSLIETLRQIRTELRRTVSDSDELRAKLVGPAPMASANKNGQISDSIRSLIREIRVLSSQLSKQQLELHTIVGLLGPTAECGGDVEQVG